MRRTNLQNSQFFLLSMLLLAVSWRCVPEPERENPLDPTLAQGRVLEGRAYSFYEPRIPLSGVQITLLPEGRRAFTDAGGNFELSGVPAGNYQIIAERPLYHPDTVQVTVQNDGLIEAVNFFLNAVPQVIRRRYVSRHVDEVFPGEFYDAVFSLVLNDADGIGDLGKIDFRIPSLDYIKQFQPTGRPDSFFVRILDIEFDQGSPADNLHLLTENEARIVVNDRPGAKVEAGPFALQRIIRELPEPREPVFFDTTTAVPRFVWNRFDLPYNFNYTLRIERNVGGTAIEVLTTNNISEDSLGFTYPDSLPNGIYQWYLGAVDNLGNSCRARKADFIVSQ